MKCADVDAFGLQDGAQVLQWPCGNGTGEPTANQQVTIEYVEGTSYDTVVQLRFAHSGKCLTVTGNTSDDLAPIQQQSCGQLTTQRWVLRPSYNDPQVMPDPNGRFRVEAATSHNVLDIKDCAATNDVRMWEWVTQPTPSPCQKWQLVSQGDDVYSIVDPSSNRAIDIEGCSKQLHGNVIAFAANNSECQRWRIEPSTGSSSAGNSRWGQK
jgi:hypothetical protein